MSYGGTVYFFRASGTGRIKIGFTARDVAKRLQSVHAGSPVPVELLTSVTASTRQEALLHIHFMACRVHGEWFEPHPDLLALIDEVAKTGTLPEAFAHPEHGVPRVWAKKARLAGELAPLPARRAMSHRTQAARRFYAVRDAQRGVA